MNTKFNPQATLYHGTIDLYASLLQAEGIKIIKRAKKGVDFGPGFYVTVGKENQARKWATVKSQNPPVPSGEILAMLNMSVRDFVGIRSEVRPVILAYRIRDPLQWLALRHKEFRADDSEWQKHVWMCRQESSVPNPYDWVFGPVADGGLNKESHHSISAYAGMNQLAVHNETTARMLKLVEVILW